MHPSEPAQVGIVEGLDAERDPVDAGRAVALEALCLDARRVGFERHLGARRDLPGPRDRVEDRTDRLRPHEGRRAAAEEDARHGAAGRPGRRMGDLPFGMPRTNRSWSTG